MRKREEREKLKRERRGLSWNFELWKILEQIVEM